MEIFRRDGEYGVGLAGVGLAKRHRKSGNPAKSDAFKAGKKRKRQRKQRKLPKSAAFPRLTILRGEVSYSSHSISFSHLSFGRGYLAAFSCCRLR